MKSTLLLLLIAMMGCKQEKPAQKHTLIQPNHSITHDPVGVWWVTVTEHKDPLLRVDVTQGTWRCYLNQRNDTSFVIECDMDGAK